MPEEFNFDCPHCGRNIAAIKEWSGAESQCPVCNETLTVPTRPVTPFQPRKIIPLSSSEDEAPQEAGRPWLWVAALVALAVVLGSTLLRKPGKNTPQPQQMTVVDSETPHGSSKETHAGERTRPVADGATQSGTASPPPVLSEWKASCSAFLEQVSHMIDAGRPPAAQTTNPTDTTADEGKLDTALKKFGNTGEISLTIKLNLGMAANWGEVWEEIQKNRGNAVSLQTLNNISQAMGKQKGMAYVTVTPSISPDEAEITSLLGSPLTTRNVGENENFQGASVWKIYERIVLGTHDGRVVDLLIRGPVKDPAMFFQEGSDPAAVQNSNGTPAEAEASPTVERVLTDLKGKKITATLLSADDMILRIHKDGKEFTIPLSTLIPSDREFVRDWKNLDPSHRNYDRRRECKAWSEYLEKLGGILSKTGDVTADYRATLGEKEHMWFGEIREIQSTPSSKRVIVIKMNPGEKLVQNLGQTLHCEAIRIVPADEQWKSLGGLKKGDFIHFATRPSIPAVLRGVGANEGTILLILNTSGLRLIKSATELSPATGTRSDGGNYTGPLDATVKKPGEGQPTQEDPAVQAAETTGMAAAAALFPELNDGNSPLSRKFAALKAKRKTGTPDFFTNPQWPTLLALQAEFELPRAKTSGVAGIPLVFVNKSGTPLEIRVLENQLGAKGSGSVEKFKKLLKPGESMNCAVSAADCCVNGRSFDANGNYQPKPPAFALVRRFKGPEFLTFTLEQDSDGMDRWKEESVRP